MFEYNGYHFEPVRKLKESEKKDICTFSKHIRSDRELGICDYNVDWKKHNYSWKDFYSASNDSQLDIFLCVENGKLYVPCEHDEIVECLEYHFGFDMSWHPMSVNNKKE